MSLNQPIKPMDDHASCEHNQNHEQELFPQACAEGGNCCTDITSTNKDISSPDTLKIPAGSVKTQIRIAQMDCPTEEALIRKKLESIPKVSSLDFNLMQRMLTVIHPSNAQTEVIEAIRSLGMTPELLINESTAAIKNEEQQPWWPLALSGIAAVGAELLDLATMSVWLVALLSLAAIAAGGLGTYKKGWIALKNGNLNINALMSIAVTGALLIGQWPEAVHQ